VTVTDVAPAMAQRFFQANSNTCGAPVPKRIIADYTPDYLRLVPPPASWRSSLCPGCNGNYTQNSLSC
jgi:hypothetical protein